MACAMTGEARRREHWQASYTIVDALEQVRHCENFIEELQIKLDESLRQADEVQENYVHGESQQLADAQERVQGLEEDLASTVKELHGETTKADWLCGFVIHELSELNSRDRKNLEEEWKKKLEKEKCEHNLELKQLKEEVRSGNQIRESLEQKIKRGEKSLEQRKEELLEKSRQFEELQGEMREVEWSTHELEQEKSELNKRIEEEQISNSRDRKNLEEELENEAGKGKTEKKQSWKRKNGKRQSWKRKNRKKQSWKKKNGKRESCKRKNGKKNKAGKGKTETRCGIGTTEGRGKIRQSDKGAPGTGDRKKRGISGMTQGILQKSEEMRMEDCKTDVEMSKKLGEKTLELQKHQNKERELQNELEMLREERKRTENETLRNHTVQIEQPEAKARLKNEMQERVVKEQQMNQEKEINQLKEVTRLEKEEHERLWERKQKGQEQLKEKASLEYAEMLEEQRMKQEREINKLKETTTLENEEHDRRDRKQKENEFETDQLKERARLEYTEMEKLRKDNEQLKSFREEERLKWEGKWSQEVEQHNNMGCLTSPRGVMLVVQNLFDITRRMTPQLEQILVIETLREHTGLLTNEIHFEHVELTAREECGKSMMSNLLGRSDRTEVTLKQGRYVGTCIHGADEELMVEIEFYVNEETLSDGVHVCVTPEGVCEVLVNECCVPTLQTTAPVCAAEAETCVGTHSPGGRECSPGVRGSWSVHRQG
uniref:Uncharacterized protein n=1 Tax=Eptatretus burgeri TaxID=7764 RepID=A0A8C4NG29_EPTBU